MLNGFSKAEQDPDGAAVERTEDVAGATSAGAGHETLALVLPSDAWLLVAAACLTAELKSLSLTAPEFDTMVWKEFMKKPVSVTAVEQSLLFKRPQKRLDRLVQGAPRAQWSSVDVDVCRLQLCLAHVRRKAPIPYTMSLAETVMLLVNTSLPDCTIRHCAFFLRRSHAENRACVLEKLAKVNIAGLFSSLRDTWIMCLWGDICVGNLMKLLLLLALRSLITDPLNLPGRDAAELAGELLETWQPLAEIEADDGAQVDDEPGEDHSAENEEDRALAEIALDIYLE